MSLVERARFLRHPIRLRRRLRGPARPSWTVDYEAAALLFKLQGPVLKRAPLPFFRRHVERLLGTPAPASFRFEPARLGGVRGEWFRHEGERSDDVLVYLHGGGYIMGSIDTHRELICDLASAAGCRALALDYRLAPEHRAPAQIDDVVSAYEALLARGVPPGRVVLGGESAGGGLTLSALVALRARGAPLPRAAVVLSPWVDLEPRGESAHRNEAYDYVTRDLLAFARDCVVGDGDPRDPRVSPIHADLSGLPPLLIQAGEAETLRDGAIELEARARAAGVDARLEVYPDMIHVWHFFGASCPAALDAVQRIGEFVERTR